MYLAVSAGDKARYANPPGDKQDGTRRIAEISAGGEVAANTLNQFSAANRRRREICIMTITALVIFEVKAGLTTALEAAMNTLLEATRNDTGFVRCDRYRDTQDPTRYVFHEVWDSKALLDEHLRTAHVACFLRTIMPLLDGKDVRILQGF
ncbi:putative quinol monooxygenase [Paraburkholderia sp.]|uniref:putative quinol monooxygenase n=1 Tax=Paraburkholderia sp. TaxID=1926495 RepID=UPI003C7E4302